MYSFESKLTAYYPDDSPMEGGFVDMRDRPLCTLQDYMEGKVGYVSVAMDRGVLPYGCKLCIPAFEKAYDCAIEFRVVDTGSAFTGKGKSRMDICVKDKAESLKALVNSIVFVVVG